MTMINNNDKRKRTMMNLFKPRRWSNDLFKELMIIAASLIIALIVFLVALLIASSVDIALYHPSAAIVGGLSLVLLYWILRSTIFDSQHDYHPIDDDEQVVMSHNDIVYSIHYRGNEAVIDLLDNGDTACARDVARLLKNVPKGEQYHANHRFYRDLVEFTEKYSGHHWISQWLWYYRNRFGKTPTDTNKPSAKQERPCPSSMQSGESKS